MRKHVIAITAGFTFLSTVVACSSSTTDTTSSSQSSNTSASSSSAATSSSAGSGSSKASSSSAGSSSASGGTNECTNAADQAIVTSGAKVDGSTQTVEEIVQSCATASEAQEPATKTCILGETGLSTACGTCFDSDVNCVLTNCLSQCAAGPSTSGCQTCQQQMCAASFDLCSGLTGISFGTGGSSSSGASSTSGSGSSSTATSTSGSASNSSTSSSSS